jgi:hypothetical protein
MTGKLDLYLQTMSLTRMEPAPVQLSLHVVSRAVVSWGCIGSSTKEGRKADVTTDEYNIGILIAALSDRLRL